MEVHRKKQEQKNNPRIKQKPFARTTLSMMVRGIEYKLFWLTRARLQA